ncbi:STN domain-containing protein [Sphingomonas hankookensis]|uniref:Secretin/TonB short N-terminal domain-containing protein n=1 Tax=Sphingomonas hengshuiensis TaxID=1609977 RepID=A0A2W4Z9B6_9SPHN|nr:MAG: hypothetical protein DI632_05940 [Sphingomonas hengshuiensis]
MALAVAVVGATVPAAAQDATPGDATHRITIPAGPLSQGVLALSAQAGVQVVFESGTVGSVTGNAVTGTLTTQQALDGLLAGTGLRWRWLRAGVVTIEAGITADAGERVTGAVRVEAAQGATSLQTAV